MTVQFRLKELVAQKERLEGRRLTYRKIADEANVSTDLITKMANNRLQNINVKTLQKLLSWLDCDPGDLIVKT